MHGVILVVGEYCAIVVVIFLFQLITAILYNVNQWQIIFAWRCLHVVYLTLREWFQRFKNDNFDMKKKERPDQPKIEVADLQALLDETPAQTLKDAFVDRGQPSPSQSKRKIQGQEVRLCI